MSSSTGRGILRRNEKIGREAYRIRDRIRCYIKDVRRGPRPGSSCRAPTRSSWRNSSRWKCRIYDGIIEIKAVARDPGSAKIAVISYDNAIDPVGAASDARQPRAGGGE